MGYMFQTVFCQVDKVTDELYISSAHGVHPKKLQAKGITCVINVTMEMADVRAPGVEVMAVRVADVPHTNLSLHFDRCADKIHEVHRKGGRTLVHCMAGVSRSASVCLAYLMKYYQMTLLQAYTHLKSARSVVHPNHGFFRQLINYERKLFKTVTVKMVTSREGLMPDIYKKEMDAWYEQSRMEYINRRQAILDKKKDTK